MKFKQIREWIRGLYKNKQIEHRIPDDALIKIHNLDIDETGKIIRRWGYVEWDNFQALVTKYPTINKLQNIYQFTDVGGDRRDFIVADGFVYMQYTDDEDNLQWVRLNDEQFSNTEEKIAITAYFDKIFFNDTGTNIWVYDVKYNKLFGYYIEFSGDKIYFYDINNFSQQASLEIEISTTSTSAIGKKLYDDIATATGNPTITIDINWFAKDINGNYFILNQGNTSSTLKQLIKINNNLVFDNWIEYTDADGNLRIKQFGLWENKIYFWGEETRIDLIDTTSFTIEERIQKEWLRFPRDINDVKISYISVDKDRIYMYSHSLDPDSNIPLYTQYYKFPIYDDGVVRWNDYNEGLRQTGYHHNGNDFVNFQNYDVFADHRAAPPFFKILKSDGEKNYLVASAWSDWIWRAGKGFDDDWYIQMLKNQTQREDLFSSLSINSFDSSGGGLSPNINYFNSYIKSELFLKQSAVFEKRMTYVIFPSTGNEYSLDDFWALTYDFGDPDGEIKKDGLIFSELVSERISKLYMKYGVDKNNSDIFESPSLSKYTALLILDRETGLMREEHGQVRWLPLTLKTEGVGAVTHDEAFNPIFVYRDLIHFGDKFNDKRYLYSYNLSTTKFICKIRDDALGVYPNNYRMYKFKEAALLISFDVDAGNTETKIYENLERIDDSELINYPYYISSAISDYEIVAQQFVIHKLNTPLSPKYNVSVDATSVLKQGFYRYAMVYVFGNDTRTLLGVQTDPIEITADDNFEINLFALTLGVYYDGGSGDNEIKQIEVYRQDSSDGVNWSELPFLISTIDTTVPSPVEIYTDDKENSDYDPKNYYQESLEARRFKFNDIYMHKNRLNMVNDLTVENSNILLVSDIDNPENIPPTNINPIESGDGDRLVGGISVRDYNYLFKEGRIYGILGDSLTGSPILDIYRTAGVQNSKLIAQLNDVVYFLDQTGMHHIKGNKGDKIGAEKLKDFFDPRDPDSINFTYIKNAFSDVDKISGEVKFFVPIGDSEQPNHVLLYNQKYDYFHTYGYFDTPLDENSLFDIVTNKSKTLIAAFKEDGNNVLVPMVYELVRNNNDDGKKIKWRFVTKFFNISTIAFKKIFRLIRISGKYFTDITINYNIDNTYRYGDVEIRKNNEPHVAESFIDNGIGYKIAADVLGEDYNRDPVEIDELILGYDKLARMR